MSAYPFKEIELKWQAYWEKNQSYKVVEDPSFTKEKRMYVLDMFPYPSGAGLHVGHPEGYTATDIYCRYLRHNNYNVLHPMGYDSFGLPAENYAIATGTHPQETTSKNIKNFEKQIKRLGFCYDWSRSIRTSDPSYYKFTQWIFLQLYKKGLAYEAETPINWCSSCLTGLANEEVKDGCCERCGNQVTRKNLRQWMLKITEYAQRLLDDLDDLDWSDSIKQMQRNWIGRSEGASVIFKCEKTDDTIKVFTTRCDTLFGATYMVLSPEHPLVKKITTKEQKKAVEDYIEASAKKSDLERTDLNKDKSGVFTGSYAVNPVNNKLIPIWIADYVLISYGTGAIMAVPAHDTRDWEFAKKFKLPIIQVLEGEVDINKEAWTKDGVHINSGFLDGLNKKDAINKMLEFLQEKKIGEKTINFKLRDWVFSRQRYWGEPIPLVHCEKCGTVALDEKDLPLTLPEVESYKPAGTGESPLASIDSWVNTTCPKCNGPAKRETNTMPQWAGSCWYYLRYLDPNNDKEFVSKEALDYWMPVDLYVGGAEHAVLHLLYARFWHKVLFDLGYVKNKEPFKKLVNQGMITSFAYQRPNKTLVAVDNVEEYEEGKYREKETNTELVKVIAKMSKSLKNVINPDDIIEEYGCDSMRLYEMFMGPLQDSKPWSTTGISGISRFLDRVWRLQEILVDEDAPKNILKVLHQTIEKVTVDTSTLNFNTAISQMMILVNSLYKEGKAYKKVYETLVILLSPYTPHLSEELWHLLGNTTSVVNEKWPTFDKKFLVDDEVTVVFQINGKLRSKAILAKDLSKEEITEIALADEKIIPWLEGKTIVKTIAIVNKLVNIVVK